jgi:PAS domain S-box-containing protein
MTQQLLQPGPSPACGDAPFRLLADHLPALCFIADPAGKVLWCNRRWYDYTGAAADAALDDVWPTLHHPNRRKEVARRWQSALETGRPAEMALPLLGGDGHYRPFLARMEPVRDDEDRLSCWLGTLTEIPNRRETEHNQRFLLELGDALRDEVDPAAILHAIGERLAAHLNVARVGYGEVSPDGQEVSVAARGWVAGGMPGGPGVYRLDDFGREAAAMVRRGEILVVGDVLADPAVGPNSDAHLGVGVRAGVTVPLVKRGGLAAIFYVHSPVVRRWRDVEVQLIRDVAERTWATLERARAEADRRDSEERLRLALEGGMLGIMQWDLTTRRGSWSKQARAIFGVEAGDEVSLEQLTGAVHPEDRERVLREVRKAIKGGARYADEYRVVHADGSVHWVVSRARVEREADGRAVRAAGVVADITDRKLAEERLRESEGRFRGLFETAHEGVWLVDRKGRTLFINHRMAGLLGYAPEEISGRPVPEFCFPEDFAAARERIANNLAGRPEQFEFRFRRRDGSALPVLAASSPLWDGAGHVVGAVGMFSDLTERKQADAELQRSREALYQSEKLNALGSLLAGVSHELNNPLSVVLSLSQLLEIKAAGTAYGERAAKIRAAAERCAKIVQTFLAMARQKAPVRTHVDGNEVLDSALELTGYALRTAGIEVVTDLAPDLPPLNADADQLNQVLVNLIVNAQHALEERPKPRILELRTSTDERRRSVRLEVADNGPGVPPEHRRRIFEPFFTSKPQGVGTGIGLTFSLAVVQAHGGTLTLADPADGGACFTVELPAVVDVETPREPVGGGADRSPQDGTALVIDDEADLAEALAEMLELEHYRTDLARSGREGRRLIEARSYDVILSDLRMPDADGQTLFDWIERERPALAQRVAFVTGDTLGPAARRFLDCAGRPVLEKPFDQAGLRSVLAELGRPSGFVHV